MSTAPRGGPALVDLEKELVCSICTELLYQPLTLLDCLHTFCGSCLKEWFSAQGSRPRSSRSSPRFTCPSCRAVVRETRPNATVTTLLDMILAASPDRVKSDAEKEEIAEKYKPGDSVFPTAAPQVDSSVESDEDDRRLLEEVRELSLQDSTRPRGQNHRARHSSRTRHVESTDSDGRSRRRRDEDRTRRQGQQRPAENASERTRRVEHQSSLRSLLSLSDAETMEEEILRQIIEEGLLDDIDMENLGPRQEEELSERIADAYRRRHRMRSRSQQRQETQAAPPTSSSHSRTRSQSVQRPPPASTRESPRNPPVSRPYLLEPLVQRPGHSGHQRRLSEQGSSRRRTSPVPVNPASSSEVALRPATRSSSDMTSERARSSQNGRVRTSESTPTRPRRATESEQGIPHIWTGSRERTGRSSANSPTALASPMLRSVHTSIPLRPGHSASASNASLASPSFPPGATQNGRSRTSSWSNASQPPALYAEPSISCDRCGGQNIQYDLHKKCSECKDGNYHLCMRCYRLGRGCLQWVGFAPSADANFERMLASSTNGSTPAHVTPHILFSFKYQRPSETARVANEDRQMTSDDPARRLQAGLFCDICQSTANDCFWKCNQCNEGDWGFCNGCVNQGKCCTHALLPICRITPDDHPNPPHSANTPDVSSTDRETFKILSFSTQCDICTYPIPASTTRFHCLECNDGDYDMCTNCYLKLGATGKISKENGHNGWRRCPKGHRMIIIGFEDHEEGQRRVIVRDLVGGRALKDEHVLPSPTVHTFPTATPSPEVGTGDWSWKEGTERRKKASRTRTPWTANGDRDRTNTPEPAPTTPIQSSFRRFPPDGGVGLTAHALWSWYPDAGVEDELMFPRGAEITEAENINDDWYWGCYAGLTGLFPGAHVSIVGEIA
ncbi:hypothetical protein ASPWEDRAFT_119011 [Aspergillus wentii DTO 134E9]|uniref:RING-type domain-containing protein n=1 Tax=Aspergillus wentii DTO 134E9 TaxID=1073089 RepID=A0A1L9R9K9_ASPWE|nr:uncharacterized protein ASPWEDRAFT_119011 [Aspergillus wentii DTO 134E9]OJJ31547.1 hypothetical protein ASPWEDRAFT_119011 [Aspergillus wentii DTO 134E9]